MYLLPIAGSVARGDNSNGFAVSVDGDSGIAGSVVGGLFVRQSAAAAATAVVSRDPWHTVRRRPSRNPAASSDGCSLVSQSGQSVGCQSFRPSVRGGNGIAAAGVCIMDGIRR